MPTLMKKIVSVLFALCVITPAIAQSDVGNWPSQRPIKIIAVFPPGGSVDQVARILAPVLQAELKQNVIVENIGGASGVIGTPRLLEPLAMATPLVWYLIHMALIHLLKITCPMTRSKIWSRSI